MILDWILMIFLAAVFVVGIMSFLFCANSKK